MNAPLQSSSSTPSDRSSVFEAYDRAGRDQADFAAFAQAWLANRPCGATIRLTSEQARVLAEIVNSFVDGAEAKHRKALLSADPDASASADVSREADTLPYGAVEKEIARNKEAFKGMSKNEIEKNLETGNRLFRWIRHQLLRPSPDRLLEELTPHLDEKSAKDAVNLFRDDLEKPTHVDTVESNELPAHDPPPPAIDAFTNQTDVEQLLRIGRVALDVRSSDPNAPVAECISRGIWSELLSAEEALLKKLFALELLPDYVAAKCKDDLEFAPMVALFAAKTAVESIADVKTTFHLDRLERAAEAFLAPAKDGKETR